MHSQQQSAPPRTPPPSRRRSSVYAQSSRDKYGGEPVSPVTSEAEVPALSESDIRSIKELPDVFKKPPPPRAPKDASRQSRNDGRSYNHLHNAKTAAEAMAASLAPSRTNSTMSMCGGGSGNDYTCVSAAARSLNSRARADCSTAVENSGRTASLSSAHPSGSANSCRDKKKIAQPQTQTLLDRSDYTPCQCGNGALKTQVTVTVNSTYMPAVGARKGVQSYYAFDR